MGGFSFTKMRTRIIEIDDVYFHHTSRPSFKIQIFRQPDYNFFLEELTFIWINEYQWRCLYYTLERAKRT